MSVVCAKVYDDHIEIASDSGLFLGDMVIPGSAGMEKLFRVDYHGQDLIIGGVGTYSQGVLLQDFLKEYEEPIESSVHGILDFFVAFYQYSAAIRSCDDSLKKGEEDVDAFLMIVGGKLFYISGLDVFTVDNYIAIGAGQPYALTALACGASPVEAVEKSIDLCVFLRKPIIHYEVSK